MIAYFIDILAKSPWIIWNIAYAMLLFEQETNYYLS